MAYNEFTLQQLIKQFGITIDTTVDLYSHLSEVPLSPTFLERLDDESSLALEISTEKARSEFIIAPILSETRRMSGHRFGLLSGVEFTVDASAGLTGFCDYILTHSRQQLFVESPVLMLVEAKNEDMKRGYGQCIAEMVAAQRFNEQEGKPLAKIYGAVTIGNIWKFIELENKTARIDSEDYSLENVGKVIGILLCLLAPSG